MFRPDTTAKSFVVKTRGELEEALKAPHDSMIFIEAITDTEQHATEACGVRKRSERCRTRPAASNST